MTWMLIHRPLPTAGTGPIVVAPTPSMPPLVQPGGLVALNNAWISPPPPAIIRPPGLIVSGSAPVTGSYPGQSGNPVGYAATPASTPAKFTAAGGVTWPGAYPGSLTAWPGGTGGQTISNGTHATSGAGTSGNPWVFAFYDFNALTSGINVTANNVIFVGCRFQSNDAGNYNVQTTGTGIGFIYCSITPLASLYTSPPGAAWPSASAGQNISYPGTEGVNSINGNSGYQYGISMNGGGNLTIDHCDGWGHGNDFFQSLAQTASTSVSITDCWVHDCAYYSEQAYHQDGIGYVNGGAPPFNWTINHCTIASIGNTNGIAFQAATAPYSNFTITNNYFSGFGSFGDFGHDISGNTNWTVTDNVFGTDLQWYYGPLYSGASNFTGIASNLWRRNTLKVYPGSTPASTSSFSFTSADDGKYLLPNSTLSTTDWAN